MDDARGVRKDGKGWPLLRSAQELDCDGDGKNPMTGRLCVLGDHRGYHRDEVGAEWLDDGTEYARTLHDPRD